MRITMPCASRLRRGSLDVHPCTFAHARASVRARPAGILRRSLRCSAPREAPFVARTVHPGLRLDAVTNGCAAAALDGPLARGGTHVRQDGAHDARQFANDMDVIKRTPRDRALESDASAAGGGSRCSRFSWQQEKVTRSPQASGSLRLSNSQAKQDMDSRLRGNDEHTLVRAFAETASQGAVA